MPTAVYRIRFIASSVYLYFNARLRTGALGDVAHVYRDDWPAAPSSQPLHKVVAALEAPILRLRAAARLHIAVNLAAEEQNDVGLSVGRPRMKQARPPTGLGNSVGLRLVVGSGGLQAPEHQKSHARKAYAHERYRQSQRPHSCARRARRPSASGCDEGLAEWPSITMTGFLGFQGR